MGFISTIVYMFIAGLIVHYLYKKHLRKKNKDALVLLGMIVIFGTWIVQALIYYDLFPLPGLLSQVLPWIPAQSGRTWLWNSWQFWQFTSATPGFIMPAGDGQFAIALALSYLFWFYLGTRVGKLIVGTKSHEQGLGWMFGPDKGQANAPKL
jgi:hypothetical protein